MLQRRTESQLPETLFNPQHASAFICVHLWFPTSPRGDVRRDVALGL